MSKPALRQEEQLSAELLERFLSDRGLPCSWTPGANLPAPPDLDFFVTTVDGSVETWAVEVTGLLQYIDWQGQETNRYVFTPTIFRMVDRINRDLGPQMKHAYSLSVSGPFIPAVLKNLDGRIREYVVSGKVEEEELDHKEAREAEAKNITGDLNDPLVQWALDETVKGRHHKITIKAVEGQGRIGVLSGISGVDKIPGSDELVADVAKTLSYTAKRILQEKLPIMAKVEGYKRKMLLVWSAIPYAQSSEVAMAFQAEPLEGIDGIFFIESVSKSKLAVVAKAEMIPADHLSPG